jgi:hypothetical protein
LGIHNSQPLLGHARGSNDGASLKLEEGSVGTLVALKRHDFAQRPWRADGNARAPFFPEHLTNDPHGAC